MSDKKISRRDFLKGMVGAATGIAVGVALPKITRADSLADGISYFLNRKGKVSYTDSLGRKVVLPKKILSVIPSGIFAQTILVMLCPDKLATLARPIMKEDLADYENADLGSLARLPESGEMFPDDCHDDIDTEMVEEVDTIVMLDIGSPKEGQCERFEVLEEETCCVTIFIDATVGNLGGAFRKLGGLLGCEERAEELAGHVEAIQEEIRECRENVTDDIRVFYACGSHGIARHTGYSFQNEVISMLGFTPVDVPASSDEKQIDIYSLKEIETDYIIFADRECYDNIMNQRGEDYEIWGEVDAIKRGAFAVAPALFQNWMGTPLVQTMGALWLGNLLLPNIYDYSICDEVRKFYYSFFNVEMDDDDIVTLLGLESLETLEQY